MMVRSSNSCAWSTTVNLTIIVSHVRRHSVYVLCSDKTQCMATIIWDSWSEFFLRSGQFN